MEIGKFRRASRVALIDLGCHLFPKHRDLQGIFEDMPESHKWRLSGDTVVQLSKAFELGVRIPRYEGKANLEDLDIVIERVVAPAGNYQTSHDSFGVLLGIEAAVLGPEMLDLTVTWEGGFVQKLTYCGRYCIEWDNDAEDTSGPTP